MKQAGVPLERPTGVKRWGKWLPRGGIVGSALGVFGLSCGSSAPSSREGSSPNGPEIELVYPCEWTEAGRPEQLSRLGCPADHVALAGLPAAAALPANRSVLFLIERNKDNALRFIDSLRWRHFTFAREKLDGYEDLSAFNAEMYYRPERRLLLGTVTYYVGSDVYALELAPIDKASPELIAEAFTLVQSRLLWPADLRYHPTSNALEMTNRLPQDLPLVNTEELWRGATYQGMSLGRTIGRLHLTTLAKLGTEYVSRSDIVVVDHVPNDLPAAAGLVTGEFQTPLAHVNLLSQNRGSPNMALLDATKDERFVKYDGRWVDLEVRADGFSVYPVSAEAAAAFWQDQRPLEVQVPALDLSVTDITDVSELDLTRISQYGGKAANLGELSKIRPELPLPVGFAIPCSAYLDFMQDNGLVGEVDQLLADPALVEDANLRKVAFAELRRHIADGIVDPGLLAAIEERALSMFGAVPTRLRSSSNAEDLVAFNGAGLYESHSFEPGNASRPLDSALKRVWASLWNDSAFEERDWARIDHRATAMGVLVHRSYPDDQEAANGVAITANPFDPPPDGQAAYYINVQPGAESVTNPKPGTVPESLLYYKPPAGQGEMTYFSRSSLNGGVPVLAFDEIVTLTQSLKAIHEHYARIYRNESKFGMDVEFKLVEPERALVIKQARRYTF